MRGCIKYNNDNVKVDDSTSDNTSDNTDGKNNDIAQHKVKVEDVNFSDINHNKNHNYSNSDKLIRTGIIEKKSDVIMHMDIRLKDGSIAESTKKLGKPVSFKLGDGVFSDNFEQELLGLKAGDNKKFVLEPIDAFGESHPANIYQVPVDRFAGFAEPLEVGLIIEFAQISGNPQLGIVREIGEDEVSIDFNHPLSGHVLLFDVNIIAC